MREEEGNGDQFGEQIKYQQSMYSIYVASKVCISYEMVKEQAMDNEEWRKLHQQEHYSYIRRRIGLRC